MTHKISLEQELLGLTLQHPEKIVDLAESVPLKYFAENLPRLVYEMMLDQYKQDGKISRTKLFINLKKSGIIDNPDEFISTLNSGFTPLSEYDTIVQSIKETYHRNQLLEVAKAIQQMASKDDVSLSDLQGRAQDLVFGATEWNNESTKHVFDAENALIASYTAYSERKHGNVPSGLMSGYKSVDNIIGGFKPGHLVILAASTSMGKTSFALNIAANALKRNDPVAVISLEMSSVELMDRCIVSEAQIHGWKYSQGILHPEEEQRMNLSFDRIAKWPLLISDERGMNTSQIRARLRKFKSQMGKLSLVVVDYLQLIQLTDISSKETSARQIGQVCVQLRNLAGDLGCPIILLSQISRSFAGRQDKRPVLSDLRDSGNIEEVADSVIFLYRHAHTSVAAREQCREEGTEKNCEVIVAKNRTGGVGATTLLFEDTYTRFFDMTAS